MDHTLIVGIAMFAFVSSITPGPNNLMLAASGLTFGIRKTTPLLIGIVTGFQALLWGIAAGLGVAFERFTWLHLVLRLFGAAYLLYLAWQLWQASATEGAALAKPLGFTYGFVFQAINPKAYLMTIGAVSAYTSEGSNYWGSVFMIAAAFLLLGTPSVLSWVLFGAAFRAALRDPRNARFFGRFMAVLTAASCVLVLI